MQPMVFALDISINHDWQMSGLDAKHEIDLIQKNSGRWPAPTREELLHQPLLSENEVEWLVNRFIGHPGNTITGKVRMTGSISELKGTFIGSEFLI